jgi:hypothetical protein
MQSACLQQVLAVKIDENSTSVNNYTKIRCPNTSCLYEWEYRRRFRFYATCPSCRRNVKISENKVEVTAI